MTATGFDSNMNMFIQSSAHRLRGAARTWERPVDGEEGRPGHRCGDRHRTLRGGGARARRLRRRDQLQPERIAGAGDRGAGAAGRGADPARQVRRERRGGRPRDDRGDRRALRAARRAHQQRRRHRVLETEGSGNALARRMGSRVRRERARTVPGDAGGAAAAPQGREAVHRQHREHRRLAARDRSRCPTQPAKRQWSTSPRRWPGISGPRSA